MERYTDKQYQILEQRILLELSDIGKRIKENHHAEFQYEKSVVELIIARCANTDQDIDQIIVSAINSILAIIAKKILDSLTQKKAINTIAVSADKNNQQFNCVIT